MEADSKKLVVNASYVNTWYMSQQSASKSMITTSSNMIYSSSDFLRPESALASYGNAEIDEEYLMINFKSADNLYPLPPWYLKMHWYV